MLNILIAIILGIVEGITETYEEIALQESYVRYC